MRRDWSLLRRWVNLVAMMVLLLFVGVVATRGPAPRDARSPVLLSRASGLAYQSGAINPQLVANGGGSGPFLASAPAAVAGVSLRELPPVPSAAKNILPELQVNENHPLGPSHAALPDPVLQAPAGPSQPSQAMPRLLQNFAGLGFSDSCIGGQCGSGWPPDTNGDVGPNHYVQVVNTSIGIFNKTGTLLQSMTLDTFFQSAPAPCNVVNNGDPVALYDAQADRWIVTDFAWADTVNNTGPFYECIAASQTGDPTGAWWYYALRTDDTSLSDYPKLGVWRDGIYMSANMFCKVSPCTPSPGTWNYVGARVWAISPTQLYNGTVLTTVVFNTDASYFSLLPSNFRGAAPPPGTPNYFVSNDIHVNALDVFRFHVDWTHPLSSTFSATPTQITEAPYAAPPDNVPVLHGNAVDTLNDRLMMQNQYRNLSGAESLWLVHTAGTTPAGVPTGIRWYQLNVTGGTVALTPAQQSTYAPADGLNRWMPSLAVDKFGNMAVGYSAASASHFADIRYAGRLVTDTANTLGQSEAVLMAGAEAQSNGCGPGNPPCTRWGDYSAMTVDPVDDCTLWYTTEYYALGGGASGNWQTRIGSFRYPVCGPVPPPLTPRAYLPVISTSPVVGAWNSIMQEGFEGAWPSAGWQVSGAAGQYFWAESNCHASSGSNSAWAIGGGSLGQALGCGANYTDTTNSWMVYGPFSLANATAADFAAKLWINSEPNWDWACLVASTDDFSTQPAGTCYSGNSGGAFLPETLDLSNVDGSGTSLLGQPSVWVAVVFQSDEIFNYPGGAYADDLLLRQCTGGACPVAAATASNLLTAKPAHLTLHPARP